MAAELPKRSISSPAEDCSINCRTETAELSAVAISAALSLTVVKFLLIPSDAVFNDFEFARTMPEHSSACQSYL